MISINKNVMLNKNRHLNTSRTYGTYGITSTSGILRYTTKTIGSNFKSVRMIPDGDWGLHWGLKGTNLTTGNVEWIVYCYCAWNSSKGGPHTILDGNDLYGYGTINGVQMSSRDFTITCDIYGEIKWSTPNGLISLTGKNIKNYTNIYYYQDNDLYNGYYYWMNGAYLDYTIDVTENTFLANNYLFNILDENTTNLLEYCNKQINILGLTDIPTSITSINSFFDYCLGKNIITQEQVNSIKIYNTSLTNMSYTTNNDLIVIKNMTPITITPTIINYSLDSLYFIIFNKVPVRLLNQNDLSVSQVMYYKFKVGSKLDTTADIKLDYINRIDTIDAININIKSSNIIN